MMKSQTIARLQLLLLNSKNERQKKAIEATLRAYLYPNNRNDQSSTMVA